MNTLGILHLFMILFFQFLTEPFVILGHFLSLELLPLKINLLLKGLLLFPRFHLDLLLSSDITHEHLAVEGLDHVLVVMEHLIGFIKLLLSESLLIRLLFGVNSSPFDLKWLKYYTYLIVFEFLDTLVLLAFSFCNGGVGPLANPCN